MSLSIQLFHSCECYISGEREEFIQVLHNLPLGLKDESIFVTCLTFDCGQKAKSLWDLTKHDFVAVTRINMLVMTKSLSFMISK